MSADQFRQALHEAADWVADYLERAGEFPVLPAMKPGALIDALPPEAPEHGEAIEAIFDDFRKLILPAVTHWNHPRFMAYFATSASGVGVLGELLTAAINSNGMLWKSSPASTELEQVTLGWIRRWLGLPQEFFGIIYDTASTSTMHAIAAARERADPGVRLEGGSRDLVLYTSAQSHSSVEKGAIAIGIGQRNVRSIDVDSAFRMRPDALEAAIAKDRTLGLRPFCAVATVGTTATASIDPVRPIAEIAAREGLWLHIDAAYAGSAVAVCPELAPMLDGAAAADSIVLNPHKWMFTPVDLSAFYTRHPEILRRAYQLVPDYLRTSEDPRALNYMDYGVPLGRRFRALKLWFTLRSFGREGIARVIRAQIQWARELSEQIAAHPDFELAAPQVLSVVCFRKKAPDSENQRLLDAINASGRAFLSHAKLNGRLALRLAIGNIATTRDDVMAVWDLVRDKAAAR